ncbi:transcriptional regulator [Brevundimonas sp. 2R-24]|uniref:Transcriptional regulator n=1 Tax=Peiella sedimenti TaxID=3061083 RepID=A0ABT8SNA1_9CAUL|nr:transcriptional regulator [Caulobacteraceae bacterium XZ-24]
MNGPYRFGDFVLDPAQRRLSRDGRTVDLNARYLDALILMVREAGRLVAKDRFMDEVWRGVPVTDEALTQCIRTLRRLLGDEAAQPRFIETVPKHGYRFIALVKAAETPPSAQAAAAPPQGWIEALWLGAAAMAGGGVAGFLGGMLYAVLGVTQPPEPGMGAGSILMVLVCVTMVVGLIGGAGVGFGVAAARLISGRLGPWSVLGGAAGGLIVGAFVKLVASDGFVLLLGRAPGEVTGGPEGFVLGAGVGLGAWLGARLAGPGSLLRASAVGGLGGALAGLVITLMGGQLMAASLEALAQMFPDSRLDLTPLGALFGEAGFGPVSHVGVAMLEGLLFAGCVVAAMILTGRQLRQV